MDPLRVALFLSSDVIHRVAVADADAVTVRHAVRISLAVSKYIPECFCGLYEDTDAHGKPEFDAIHVTLSNCLGLVNSVKNHGPVSFVNFLRF